MDTPARWKDAVELRASLWTSVSDTGDVRSQRETVTRRDKSSVARSWPGLLWKFSHVITAAPFSARATWGVELQDGPVPSGTTSFCGDHAFAPLLR